jgi:hypothetical protein
MNRANCVNIRVIDLVGKKNETRATNEKAKEIGRACLAASRHTAAPFGSCRT